MPKQETVTVYACTECGAKHGEYDGAFDCEKADIKRKALAPIIKDYKAAQSKLRAKCEHARYHPIGSGKVHSHGNTYVTKYRKVCADCDLIWADDEP